MASSILENEEMQFGAITFFARPHKGEMCGSNGLPLTPNSITIYGQAQILKTIIHPNLCQYVDIIRGKHERTIVVSQYCGELLSEDKVKQRLKSDDINKIAFQIVTALNILHSKNMIHRNLSPENILLQSNKDIKLFNYGLYSMTGGGKLVAFPIIQLLYIAPEVYLQGPEEQLSGPKVDIWSLGMVLAEISLGISLWSSLKLGQCIRKVLSLIHCNTSVLERIAREHNCYEKYQILPKDLKELIESCLATFPNDRPSVKELLNHKLFKPYQIDIEKDSKINFRRLKAFTLAEVYHWWQLAGGDVFTELKKQGLIRSSPPILTLPNLVLLDGTNYGQNKNQATLYDPRVVKIPLDSLYSRLSHLTLTSHYPLVHCHSEIILKSEPDTYDASQLPLIIREKDPEYQYHRVILFRRLLHGYPFTRDLILEEAKMDIPPLLRGNIWATLLNVKGNFEEEYLRIDKHTPTSTDRQIEVDIPRCHQYNELLSSSEGHKKLKRILKAWIAKNPQYVYWQGLDSLTAPFMFLHFNNEAKAFSCLMNFVPKYLHKFFLKDNSVIIQEYLAKFFQLTAFHDPELANHLHDISFIPQLFAIPWFLTMFSHVFPLHKIMHLWDKLLLGDSSFPLHIGLSILTQLRATLLASGFNECILLFSDLPEVDMEQCVSDSVMFYKSTPSSIAVRTHQLITNASEVVTPPVDQTQEFCARISVDDVLDLINNPTEKLIGAVIVDIRTSVLFGRIAAKDSINIPFSSVKLGENEIDTLGQQGATIRENFGKVMVVLDEEDSNPELFSRFLVKCKVPKVCVLRGGFNSLHSINPTILTSKR